MKRTIVASIILLFSTLCLFSCKDDFNLVSGYEETPVVMGILDQTDSVHFIKVTRTYIGDGSTSSLDIAKIPDSSYFNSVDITVKEILAGGTPGRIFSLHDTIITNKNQGAFYAPEQKVYVFYTDPSAPLLDDATYTMEVNIDNSRIILWAETKLVNGLSLPSLGTSNSSLKFAKSTNGTGEYQNQTIKIDNNASPGSEEAYMLNAQLRFDYREYTLGMADSSDHSVHFNYGDVDILPNTSYSYTASGETFYKTLKDKIPVSSSIEKRVMKGIEIRVTGASKELASFIEISQPSSNLAQNKPEYTNINVLKGAKQVIGIFASRYSLVVYKYATAASPFVQALDKHSREELCIGPLTGNLAFCSDHQADGFESWHCP